MTRGGAWLPALLLAACAGGAQPARHEDLVSGRWHWVASLDGAAATAAPDPAAYWAEFAAAGAVVVGADCNSGVGRVAPGTLQVGPIALTRRACGPQSRDARFAALLSSVRAGALDGDLLRLAAAGTELVMLRDAEARLAAVRCDDGTEHAIIFARAAAHLREGAGFRALARRDDATAAVYGDARTTVVARGTEVTLAAGAARRTCRRLAAAEAS
ncbi:MAG: META domain-containing protein [Burkholderiales bacterium]|nr:META domain-containing protein [Burkholderiales bacterium]